MRILFIGDIVGAPGRRIVLNSVDQLRRDYAVDLVIANGENSAHGKGITTKLYHQLIRGGCEVITGGNHSFSKSEILDSIETLPFLLRPDNMEPQNIGQTSVTKRCRDLRIGIYNLYGNVFMDNSCGEMMERLGAWIAQDRSDIRIVDLHGEATAEKLSAFYMYRDQLNALIGTHTHVPTADEMVVDGCAYISDVGMCGVAQSIIGRDIDEVLVGIREHKRTRYTVAEGRAVLNAVLLEIDEQSRRTTAITRIQKYED